MTETGKKKKTDHEMLSYVQRKEMWCPIQLLCIFLFFFSPPWHLLASVYEYAKKCKSHNGVSGEVTVNLQSDSVYES